MLRWTARPARPVSYLILLIGLIGLIIGLAYQLNPSLGDNFLTFNPTHILWMGVLYLIVGAILWLISREVTAEIPTASSATTRQSMVQPQEPPPQPVVSVAAPAARVATLQQAEQASAPKVAASAKDDLTRIEGIGKKSADALNQSGVFTFAQIAGMTPKELYRIVKIEHGVQLVVNATESWPKQAEYLVNGDHEGLKQYQDYLIGGRAPGQKQ
jgi:predicted flap endonuclease-1-like 5' DNA nuclease